LGASITIIGMLSMISIFSQLLFQLPGGIISDKFGRRKIIILGTTIRLIPPLIFLFAKNWLQIIPGLLIEAVRSLYQPAQNAIIADSLPSSQRGAGYGTYRMIISLPRVIMPFLGGIIMDDYGYKEGIRIFLAANVITIIISILVKSKFLKETIDNDKRKSSTKMISSKLKFSRTIWIMVAVSAITGFAVRLIEPFINIYAIEILGLSNTQLGFIQTIGGIVILLLSIPGGIFADTFGRKPVILTSMIITPLTTWGITIVKHYQQYLLLQFINSIGISLGGGGGGFEMVGGPAWEAMVADQVPKDKRATTKGLISTFTGIVGAPSSFIGGHLWTKYTPLTPFFISFYLGLVSIFIFIVFIKESKIRFE
jgi:MFS family permease